MSPVASTALLLAIFAACYAGFACLALAQGRHWREALGAERPGAGPPGRALRAAGSLTIGLGLALALLRDGPSFGALLWGVAVSAAACAVVATLTWRAHWFRPLVLALGGASAPRPAFDDSTRRPS